MYRIFEEKKNFFQKYGEKKEFQLALLNPFGQSTGNSFSLKGGLISKKNMIKGMI